MKFKITLPEGSRINWYYGHAYPDFYSSTVLMSEIYYLVPFNWLFKWQRRFSIFWYKLLFHRDWVDETMLRMWADHDDIAKELAKYKKRYYLLEKFNTIIGREDGEND